ncbi:MAG: SGNH/GDSL hydrolase family protein [Alphaproteobacteria bacterium]
MRKVRPGKAYQRAAIAVALLSLLCGDAGAAGGFDPETTCEVPEEMGTTALPLPNVAAKLKAGETVRVVVIGSASSAGMGASSLANAYPERLAGDLGKVFPGAKFAVINLSKRGQLASDMAKRFETEVAAEHPALVIWQTGTADAVKGVDLGSFGEVLTEGIDALRKLGADVILMNMQYSPHTSSALDTAPYRDYMRWAMQSRSAILFHRYAMMKYWVEEGVIDFSSPAKADQVQNDDLVHGCIAYRLAREIESAVKASDEGGAKE